MLDDAAVIDELARLRAGGLLIGFTATGPNQSDTIENPERINPARVTAACPQDVLALAAVLAQPWADVVLGGAPDAEMLASKLVALTMVVDDGLLDWLGKLAENPVSYWDERSALSWN